MFVRLRKVAGGMGKFQITAVKHSLVAFLLLIIAKTTIQQDRIDLQDTIDVLVEGPPRYILEQGKKLPMLLRGGAQY